MGVQTETYTAIVTKTDDPEKRGRIKAVCAGLLGDEDTELPDWIEPTLDWGWFYVPDIDEQVEIVIHTDSDIDEVRFQMSIADADIRWRGKRFYSDEAEAPTPVHDDFKANYGKRRGFATPNGHILYFDDTDGKQKVHLSWKAGDEYCYLTFDEKGSVILGNKAGALLYFDADNQSSSIIDEHGNTLSSDKDGMKLVDKFSNIIELKDGVVQVLSQGNLVLNCSNCSIEAASVDIIKGADQHLVRGEDLITWLAAHTHSTGMGPSGPPITPPTPADFLSTEGKVK